RSARRWWARSPPCGGLYDSTRPSLPAPPAAAGRRRPESRLAARAVDVLPRHDDPGVLGPLYGGAHGRGDALGAQAAVHGGGLPVVLRGDRLLRAAADVLPPQRLLSRHRAAAAPRGEGGRLLR